MGIFSNILDKIFHRGGSPAGAPATQTTTAAAPAPAGAAPAGGAAPQNPGVAVAAAKPVDVEAVMNEIAGRNSQQLNWRTSIVDLMKLLDLDSSLGARKELATELGYTGAKDGSAEMNLWLHKQVMKKLAENGGKVPAELRD